MYGGPDGASTPLPGPNPLPRRGWLAIYVIGTQPVLGPVKIGYSADVARRLKELRSCGQSTPVGVDTTQLALLLEHASTNHADHVLENELHRYYQNHRVEGEWFQLGKVVDEVVRKIQLSIAEIESRKIDSTEGRNRRQALRPEPGIRYTGGGQTIILPAPAALAADFEARMDTAATTNPNKARQQDGTQPKVREQPTTRRQPPTVVPDEEPLQPHKKVRQRYVTKARDQRAHFEAWLEAGFSEDQALKLVALMIAVSNPA